MLYFLKHVETGLIKIGRTKNKSVRLSQLIKEHGDLELVGLLPGYKERESELHKQFSHLQVVGVLNGVEWFAPDDELMTFIDSNASFNLPLPMYGESTPPKQRNAEFRTRLSTIMKERGVSRMYLVRKAYMSYATVMKWENEGMQSVDATIIMRLMKVLGVTFEELIYIHPPAEAESDS